MLTERVGILFVKIINLSKVSILLKIFLHLITEFIMWLFINI